MEKETANYEDLVGRIVALERAVFGGGTKPTAKLVESKKSKDDFSGATGGLRLILSKGFFDSRRKFSEIEAELKKQGYHYSKQAIQTPLNRLSTKGGSLVGLKEQGRKVYVKRK
jgi:hypothetical protein